MARQDLFEYFEPSIAAVHVLNEGSDDPKRLVLAGTAIQGDVRNRNGRIYPKVEIERAVADMKSRIGDTGPILGELDHPDNLQIALDRVTHLIKDVWMEGADGFAKFDILQAGYGELVTAMVRQGAKIGVSSRGSGSVDGDGVVSDFEIVTIDIVANPSAPNAYPKPITESFQTRKGRELISLNEAMRHDKAAQKYFVKSFETFLSELNPRKR